MRTVFPQDLKEGGGGIESHWSYVFMSGQTHSNTVLYLGKKGRGWVRGGGTRKRRGR